MKTKGSTSKAIIFNTYNKYHSMVNMSYSELYAWSKTPCSKKASLSREPIRRNLRLLKKPREKWTMKDVRDANKTISYLSRAKKIKSKNIVDDCGLTRNEIALANWGYNSRK